MMELLKLIKLPLRLLRRRVDFLRFNLLKPDYDAERFWKERHRTYGFDLRGVGHMNLSQDENRVMYENARAIFLSLCRQEKIDFAQVDALDIGCGNGFYTGVFQENSGVDYLGIDITDALLPDLRQAFPNYTFQQLDITSQQLSRSFDLIWMIDVTQHIVDEAKFTFAMQNVRTHLTKQGIFIVTSHLTHQSRSSMHVVKRSLVRYQQEFPDYIFSEPLPFRDKFIFSIRKNEE